jgi:N6-L-threonylcarbamoyladenine synthase
MTLRVLGIESSCDETAAAVVRDDGVVLSDVVASQIDLHARFGGIVPEVASRAHLRSIVPVVERALAPLAGGLEHVDAIAVTRGPGLVGALHVGVQFGKALALARGLPLVGVDHLVAHLLAVFLRRGPGDSPAPDFPYVALLASGGHSAVYEVRSAVDAELLGQTRDDAAGEAFDKVAKLLGLGYPGGPVVDRLARRGDPRAVALPRPRVGREGSLDFSFSGLKTAVARHVARHGAPRGEQALADFCASFQGVIVRSLVDTALAACAARDCRRLVLAGGVAANLGLRERATAAGKAMGVEVFAPPLASCTDNGAMVAYAGAMRLRAGLRDDLDLAVYGRSPDVRRGRFPASRPLSRGGQPRP